MKTKKYLTGFVVFIFFILISGIKAQTYDFETWVEGPDLFTIGRPETVNIYVQNLGDEDSYTISYTKEAFVVGGTDHVDHLIDVRFPSNRIESVKSNGIGDTFATITSLGPFRNGKVIFTITSESSPVSHDVTLEITQGLPVNLPEFELIGLVQILILACLIISYTSHFR